eukprot:scaffold2306_cov132-Cylindrotheca_fusiformis.AAC.6
MPTSKPKRGYFGRFLLLLLGAVAIACSISVALSCEFIGVEEVDVDDSFPDFLYLKTIGIFHYSSALETCAEYEKQFWHSSFNNFFVISQISAIVAPALGLLAWLTVISEVFFCQFYGGFVFYDNAVHCDWKLGSILSISAAAMYYVCSILLCCMPRPNPFLNNEGDEAYINNVGDVEKARRLEDERHTSDSDHTTEH